MYSIYKQFLFSSYVAKLSKYLDSAHMRGHLLSSIETITATSNNDSVLCFLILSVGLALVCTKFVCHLLMMLADALQILQVLHYSLLAAYASHHQVQGILANF
jgi:hypothetical protein